MGTSARHERWVFGVAYLLLLLVLAAGSSPRRTGDGAEYMAMALSLSQFESPSLSPEQMERMERQFAQIGSGFDKAKLVWPQLKGQDGRQDFWHFWFYPALAAPFVGLAEAVGIHPNFGFLFVNVVLLLTSFWLVLGKLKPASSLLLFASPILWWIDKAHTEVFTFALLAMAFVFMTDRPWWSFVCLGAAATQNPPIGVLLGVLGLATVIDKPDWLRAPKFWIGGVAGVLLALLHPVYYLLHLGVLSPLAREEASSARVPSLDELGAVVWDPNIGLLFNFPILVLVLVILFVAILGRRPAWIGTPAVWAALAAAALFLVVFSQGLNFNHGGTRHMARYALWLIPLGIPVLSGAETVFADPMKRWMAPAAALALLWSCAFFHPGLPEVYLEPTPVADFLWNEYPSANNPLPEIFAERLLHTEGFYTTNATELQRALRVATPTCAKILLAGGRGPERCPTDGVVPSECKVLGSLCYANRTGAGYRFRPAPLDALHRGLRRLASESQRPS